jgi:hypothetical protein
VTDQACSTAALPVLGHASLHDGALASPVVAYCRAQQYVLSDHNQFAAVVLFTRLLLLHVD